MAFKHGVYVKERGTKVTGQRSVDSAIPVVFGTAPKGLVNVPVVVRSYTEAVNEFGFSEDFETYTLSEFIDAHFNLNKQSYAILVNIADLTSFKKSSTATVDLTDAVTKTDIFYPNLDSVKLKKDKDLVKGTDYTVEHDDEGYLVITIPAGSTVTLPAAGLSLTCDVFDPSKIKAADVIGSVNPTTGKKTGFEVLDEIIPKYNVVPSIVLAPKFSTDPIVDAAMTAKAQSINGMFKAFTLSDMDTKTIKTKQKAIESKKVGDPGQYLFWPKVTRNGRIYHMSSILAGVISQMDADNDGIPSNSPSNRSMPIDGCVLADGTPVLLGTNEVNDLNGAGITTVLAFFGGPRAWGNRTAAYPNATDMKDVFVHAKRMLFWMNNWILTDTWGSVDSAITRRFIESMTAKHNMRLNGLVSMGAILGGECKFNPMDNPPTQIIDGMVKFELSVGIPGIAEHIEFGIEIDPSYLANLTI